MELELIKKKILPIRGHRVMLDFDLSSLYNIETRKLKQAVRRNIRRFPKDFMIELTDVEIDALVSQNVIPSRSKLGGAKPFAFTEQGVAMLSSVLNTDKAVEINIAIMRAFVLARRHHVAYKDLMEKIEQLELQTDKKFEDVYYMLYHLFQKEEKAGPKNIGSEEN